MSDPVVLLSTGDVVGPAGGVTNNSMVLFNGTSGKLIKGNNAVVTAAGLALLDDVNADAQRVTLGLGTAATATLTTSNTDGTVGRVLKVGDFGLGVVGAAPLLANIDSHYLATGLYWFANGAGTSPAAYGYVLVQRADAGVSMQTFTDTAATKQWIRYSDGSVWSAWKEIALTDSPAFTGIPTAPTAAAGTNTTQLANTAFVKAAVDASPRLGVGQTWQDVTSSRTPGVIYTNTSGRPICVKVTHGEAVSYNRLYVDGLVVDESYQNSNIALYTTVSAIVPGGSTYQLFATGEPGAYIRWMELR